MCFFVSRPQSGAFHSNDARRLSVDDNHPIRLLCARQMAFFRFNCIQIQFNVFRYFDFFFIEKVTDLHNNCE